MNKMVNIIGAGLAGSEAAWKLAKSGVRVRLFEMKPSKMSPAHKLSGFSELVCSNSLRSNDPVNAAGLLKEEMRRLGSLTMEAADATAVPAGKALAVNRNDFSEYITQKLKAEPLVEIIEKEVASIEGLSPLIIASGPLTSDALALEIAKLTGGEYLYFYDSVAPILDAGSLDLKKCYQASRYGYGGDDYYNFPLTLEQYQDFLTDLMAAEKVEVREFEKPQFFEGCLPIEVMAGRGPETLRWGPMKPFGLVDPSTGREPYAVVQLRLENKERTMLNMVGFQTRMTMPEQKRVFRKIPGLENAEFLRYGVIHRNTYIDSPNLLTPEMELQKNKGIYFAGQITGVEGYIESASTGLWLGVYLGRLMAEGALVTAPPHETALGSLIWHVANPNHRNFQPMNVNFGLMPIMKERIPKKMRKSAMAERAREQFAQWLELCGL